MYKLCDQTHIISHVTRPHYTSCLNRPRPKRSYLAVTASQIQQHLVSTLLGFHTSKLQKKKIQTRSCRHKALSCRPLGLTIEKDLQAKPVNLPRCAAPWRKVLNPSGVESAKQSPRGSYLKHTPGQGEPPPHPALSCPRYGQRKEDM